MALLLYHRGTLPRDRPRLYEEIMLLLLGQWDKVREGQNLAEVIGRPDWTSERLRPLLDALSYTAHFAGSSQDGRGRLDRDQVQLAFTKFFAAQTPPLDWGTAERCLTYFDQRSGLLVPDGPDSYVFAHLTLQESYSNPIEVVAWSRGFSRIEPPEGWTPFHNLRRIAIALSGARRHHGGRAWAGGQGEAAPPRHATDAQIQALLRPYVRRGGGHAAVPRGGGHATVPHTYTASGVPPHGGDGGDVGAKQCRHHVRRYHAPPQALLRPDVWGAGAT